MTEAPSRVLLLFSLGGPVRSIELLDPEDDFPLLPQLLERVVFAPLGRKKMNDDRPEIHQDPTAFGATLDSPAKVAGGSLRISDTLRQSGKHSVARPGSDDEVVRKHARAADVEQHNVLGLLGL